jgi:hypothetical protein
MKAFFNRYRDKRTPEDIYSDYKNIYFKYKNLENDINVYKKKEPDRISLAKRSANSANFLPNLSKWETKEEGNKRFNKAYKLTLDSIKQHDEGNQNNIVQYEKLTPLIKKIPDETLEKIKKEYEEEKKKEEHEEKLEKLEKAEERIFRHTEVPGGSTRKSKKHHKKTRTTRMKSKISKKTVSKKKH